MQKGTQYFSDEYLKQCQGMTVDQILDFLEGYRLLLSSPGPLKQINLRVPEATLKAFKGRAKREGISYQRKIRALMTAWAIE